MSCCFAVSRCRFCDAARFVVARRLIHLISLPASSLRDNIIGEEGAKAIAKALERNSSIVRLMWVFLFFSFAVDYCCFVRRQCRICVLSRTLLARGLTSRPMLSPTPAFTATGSAKRVQRLLQRPSSTTAESGCSGGRCYLLKKASAFPILRPSYLFSLSLEAN